MPTVEYHCRFLRFEPNPISGEFFNIAVVLSDAEGRIVDARFTPDYRRMACHPLVEMEFLSALRDEFEERRLLGEGFTEYLAELSRHLSSSLTFSEEETFFGDDPASEMDRLIRAYVATPARRSEEASRRAGPAPGSRAAVRRAMQRTFEEQQLFRNGQGLRRGVEVPYLTDGLTFTFDYGYSPASGGESYLHALGKRGDQAEASRLCFVRDRISSDGDAPALTAVLAAEVSDAARTVLEAGGIEAAGVSEVRAVGERVRAELGWT